MSIRVDAIEITSEQIRQEAQYHPAASFELACSQATQALVVRQLLLGEALRRGITVDQGNSEEAIADLMDSAVEVPEVDEAACQGLYDGRQEGFRGPDLFAPSHILFGAELSDKPARAQAKLQAEEVLKELLDHPERFARIARSRSGCPSGATGGSLGQITRGETMPPFEAAMEALQPTEMCSKPVETEHGFHVLRLDDRVPGERLPFAAVKDRILIYLRDRAWRQAVQDFVAQLAKKSTIEGYELQASGLPERLHS